MARRPKPTVTRSEQMEALVSPVRNQIHLALEMLKEASVSDLAQHLGRSAEGLYYHIDRLERAGLLDRRADRVANGRAEAVYALRNSEVRVDPRQTSPRFLRALGRGVATLLRHAQRCFIPALYRPDMRREGPDRELRIEQIQARLNQDSLREINRRLDELAAYVRTAEDAASPQFYVITTVVSPAK